MAATGPRRTFSERHAGLLAGLAVLHLVMVCVFVWSDPAESSTDPFRRAVRTYKNISGIFRDYRFFAPNVASDMRAAFVLEQPDGTSELQAFQSDNLEVGIRYNCIIGASMRESKLRDLMARSWSAVMLGTNPSASRVMVLAQSYELPSMAAYARGERPSWKVVYAGKFDRQAEGAP